MKKAITIIGILVVLLFVALQPSPKKQKEYIIVFFSNGGDSIPSLVAPSNSKVRAPKEPQRKSSKFLGWYQSPLFEDDTEFVFDKMILTKSVTLYAKWEMDVFRIVYNLEGGSFPEGAIDNYRTEFNYEDTIVYLKPNSSRLWPKHDDYGRFLGWKTIPQSEFNALGKTEQDKYPYIDSIAPKGDLIDTYPDKNVVLYAYYRNYPSA